MPDQTKLNHYTAKYSFDTNIYISIWRDNYPPDRFPTLYNDLADLIKKGIVLSSYTVKIELERQRDEIYTFFKKYKNLFVQPNKNEQKYVQILVNHPDFPKWGLGDSEKHYADPYIVALAKTHDLKGITYESGRGENTIHRACEILNVECHNFIKFLRDEDLIY